MENTIKHQYTTKEPIMKLTNLVGGYDGNIVIKDINIVEHDLCLVEDDVEKDPMGQSICIVGRSGRGKSTLFKLMTGLMRPISGSVEFNLGLVDGSTELSVVKEGDISMVDQKYTLMRHMTVFEILMFSLRNSIYPKNKRKTLIDNLLTEWGLINQKNQYPNQLSGGQKQRVSILSKSLTGKKYIVMDEPWSGLDPIASETIKDSMRRFKRQNELNTIIFSTHELTHAVEMADVIYVLGHENPTDKHSTIVKRYDLIGLGLVDKPFGSEHLVLIEDIKQTLKNS